MAEAVVAIGAIAAGTQIVHYILKSSTAIAALSRHSRNSSKQIKAWISGLSEAKQLLWDIRQTESNTSPAIKTLINACRHEVSKLDGLLKEAGSSGSEVAFVLHGRSTIEAQFSAFWTSYFRLATAKLMRALDQSSQCAITDNFPRSQREEITRNTLAIISQLHQAGAPMTLMSEVMRYATLNHKSGLSSAEEGPEPQLPRSILSAHPLKPQRLQLVQRVAIDPQKYLRLALRGLDEAFPEEFARPECLHKCRNLSKDVASALAATIEYPATLKAYDRTANLALRYCMFLLTDGSYKPAVVFIDGFLQWGQEYLPSNFDTATALTGKQAVAEAMAGSQRVALRKSQTVLQQRIKIYGNEATATAHCLNNIALTYQDLGQIEKALDYHRKALAVKRNLLGKDHPDTLVSVNNLAIVHQSQGHYLAAEKSFHRVLTGWIRVFPVDDLFVLDAKSNMGIALGLQGRLDEAEDLHQSVCAARHRILGSTHHETLKSRANCADVLNKKGHHAQAETEYRSVLKGFQQVLDPLHSDTLKTHVNIARVLFDQARYKEAAEIIVEVLPLTRARFGATHAETFDTMEARAIYLHWQQDYVTAVTVASDLFDARSRRLGLDHVDTQRSLQHLQDLRTDQREAEPAY